MRRKVAALVGLTLLLIVAGCTPREYNSNMELGKEQVQEENYLEAYDAFASAYKDKDTEEAKELRELSKLLADGISLFEQEKYELALTSFEKAAGYKVKTKEGKELVKRANEWVTKVNHAQSGSSSKEEGPLTPDDPATHEEQNVETSVTVKEPEKDQANSEPNKTDSNVTNEKNDNPIVDKKLTVKEAEQLVKDFIKIQDYPQLRVQYDHNDEKGDYIFQVFESVEDGEYGHTATWGWYGVNPKTKEVYDIM